MELVLGNHKSPLPRQLYEAGFLSRADGVPVVNGIRCAWVGGKYRESVWRDQCADRSFGHTFCWLHQHKHDLFSRASALLCVFYRGFRTRDGVWKDGGLREVFQGERAKATALLARCLLVDAGSQPAGQAAESGAETQSDVEQDVEPMQTDSDYEPEFVDLVSDSE